MNYVDTHFHILEMIKKNIDVEKELSELKDFSFLLDVAVNTKNFKERLAYKKKGLPLFFATGIHPCDAHKVNLEESLTEMESQLQHPDVVAVGETGLDYYWSTEHKEIQQTFLRAQIELAIKYNKPIILHNRNSDDDLLELLAPYKGKLRGIFHCFSSDLAVAQKAVQLGYFISFSGNVTFKNAVPLQKAAKDIPLSALLVETDAPYLSPVPLRGKPNKPSHIKHTYQYLANNREMLLSKFQSHILENVKSLFPFLTN